MFLKCKTEIVGAGVVLIYDVVKSASIAESQNVWDRAFSSLPLWPPGLYFLGLEKPWYYQNFMENVGYFFTAK